MYLYFSDFICSVVTCPNTSAVIIKNSELFLRDLSMAERTCFTLALCYQNDKNNAAHMSGVYLP